MSIPAILISEKQLEKYAESLLQSIGLTCVDTQVQIGSYKLDAVAVDKATGKIVVVELKTCAHIRSLGQLLVYRSALNKTLADLVPEAKCDVVAMLVTTFLDREVVDVVSQLGLEEIIGIKVCVGNSPIFSLVDPSEAPEDQAWYQRETKLAPRLAERIRGWNIV